MFKACSNFREDTFAMTCCFNPFPSVLQLLLTKSDVFGYVSSHCSPSKTLTPNVLGHRLPNDVQDSDEEAPAAAVPSGGNEEWGGCQLYI